MFGFKERTLIIRQLLLLLLLLLLCVCIFVFVLRGRSKRVPVSERVWLSLSPVHFGELFGRHHCRRRRWNVATQLHSFMSLCFRSSRVRDGTHKAGHKGESERAKEEPPENKVILSSLFHSCLSLSLSLPFSPLLFGPPFLPNLRIQSKINTLFHEWGTSRARPCDSHGPSRRLPISGTNNAKIVLLVVVVSVDKNKKYCHFYHCSNFGTIEGELSRLCRATASGAF